MILSLLFNFIMFIVDFIFSLLPSLPALPDNVMTSITSYIDLIVSNGLNLFYFFVRPETVAICVPLVIALVYFDEVYAIIIWILKKIPFINIH